ncbi:MAG: sugar ABC transporter substrate-binding protein [Gammaproteobacteria bacterium]|nr:MAG: sugar ABC transporter substrate-binding protein [Gammaproteobacteria bacterium]
MEQFSRCFFIVWLILGVTGCATSSSTPNLPPQTEAGTSTGVLVTSYKMGVGDEVQVSVWKNPELSVTEPIRPDGKIAVPLIGDVMAAGVEPEVMAADITKKLERYIKNPNVTVILTNLEGHAFLSRIRVTGSVVNNISINYRQGMTVLDAVLEAGSVDLYADGNNTKLHRRTDGGAVSYDIRLKDIMEDGDMTTNVMLMPGDVISVPERAF